MKILGVLIVLVSLALAGYVGVYLCFIGGVVQIVNSITMDPVVASGIAWGALRILLAGTATSMVAMMGCFFGFGFLTGFDW